MRRVRRLNCSRQLNARWAHLENKRLELRSSFALLWWQISVMDFCNACVWCWIAGHYRQWRATLRAWFAQDVSTRRQLLSRFVKNFKFLCTDWPPIATFVLQTHYREGQMLNQAVNQRVLCSETQKGFWESMMLLSSALNIKVTLVEIVLLQRRAKSWATQWKPWASPSHTDTNSCVSARNSWTLSSSECLFITRACFVAWAHIGAWARIIGVKSMAPTRRAKCLSKRVQVEMHCVTCPLPERGHNVGQVHLTLSLVVFVLWDMRPSILGCPHSILNKCKKTQSVCWGL